MTLSKEPAALLIFRTVKSMGWVREWTGLLGNHIFTMKFIWGKENLLKSSQHNHFRILMHFLPIFFSFSLCTGLKPNLVLGMFCAELSHVRLFVTPWSQSRPIAHQVPLSMGFPRQEYWRGLPFTSPGNLPNPGIETEPSRLLHWQVDSLPLHHLPGSRHTVYTIL